MSGGQKLGGSQCTKVRTKSHLLFVPRMPNALLGFYDLYPIYRSNSGRRLLGPPSSGGWIASGAKQLSSQRVRAALDVD
jgi:hypothetical protein